MKWTVKRWITGGYRARREGGPAAYIYRALNLADFSTGRSGYEVKYGGSVIAVLDLDGKGATVRTLPAAALFPEISDLDLVELAMWISKLRGPCGLN